MLPSPTSSDYSEDDLSSALEPSDPTKMSADMKTGEDEVDGDDGETVDLDSYIGRVCGNVVDNFAGWHTKRFVPSVQRYEPKKAKSLEQAYKYHKMAEAYTGMAKKNRDRHLAKTALEYLNKAIKHVPFDEPNFVCECFAQRSELHIDRGEHEWALSDIDKALHFRPHSYTAIERKMDLLVDLNRQTEACQFVVETVNSQMAQEKLSVGKRDRLRAASERILGNVYDPVEKNDHQNEESPECVMKFCRKRIRIAQDEYNGRFGMQAIENIPPNTLLLSEEPCLLMLKPDGIDKYCWSCWNKCTDTFWPCSNCTEVIYCSKDCAKSSESLHRGECGIVDLLLENNDATPAMVYRHLTLLGLEQIVDLDREVTTFPLDKQINQVNNNQSIDVYRLFACAQSHSIHRAYSLYPERKSEELAKAIYILGLYLYKNNIPVHKFTKSRAVELVRILSTCLFVTRTNAYLWTKQNGTQGKLALASLQCLIGSCIGHSCVSNAEWRFTGRNFELQSSKLIKAGQPIAITFGASLKDPFLVRQKMVNRYSVMCACVNCMHDSSEHFCLECNHCGGPVPWHPTQLPKGQCMQCEGMYEQITHAKIVQKDLETIEKVLCLLSTEKGDQCDDHLALIEQQTRTLSDYLHPRNHQFQSLIRCLTEQYITRGMYEQAVDWYLYFVDNATYLYPGADHQQDPLGNFYFLNQWAHAFASVLERPPEHYSVSSRMKYVQIGSALLERMFTAAEQWHNLVAASEIRQEVLDQIDVQASQVVNKMIEQAVDKRTRLAQIARLILKDLAIDQ